MKRGTFIVIDGTDGTGKATQTERLVTRMRAERMATDAISFPRYSTPTGRLIRQFLRGRFGDPLSVDPKFASALYAADRLAAAPEIAHSLNDGIHVVTDRYVTANLGHQGSKIADEAARKAFYAWVEDYEFGHNAIPRPDLHVILHVPAEVSMRRVMAGRTRQDEVEVLAHQQLAEKTYLEIAALVPNCHVIECVRPDGYELTVDEVHELVWAAVTKTLQPANQVAAEKVVA